MRRLLTAAFIIALTWVAPAQGPGDWNEGVRLAPDTSPGDYTFSWWGRTGRTYFIQQTDDLLSPWLYVPDIEAGANGILAWGFNSNADRTFVRLRYSDIPTSNPFLADFDGDRVGNLAELQQGTDPLHWADLDNDHQPDDWEKFHFSLTGGDGDPDGDNDGDGLTNAGEFAAGTDPNETDSDEDGLSDGEEIALGTDPTEEDSDSDGVNDRQDQYPNDSRRSEDLPLLQYVSLDLSTAEVGQVDIQDVAIDDSGQLGYAYLTADTIETRATRGGTITFMESYSRVRNIAITPMNQSVPLQGQVVFQDVNAQGGIAGSTYYLAANPDDSPYWDLFRGFVHTTEGFREFWDGSKLTEAQRGEQASLSAWGFAYDTALDVWLSNSGRLGGNHGNERGFIGLRDADYWFYGPSSSVEFAWQLPQSFQPTIYSFAGTAAGSYADEFSSGYAAGVGGSLAFLGNLQPVAINDSGKVIGNVITSDPATDYVAVTGLFGVAPLVNSLPPKWQQQIRLPSGVSDAAINNHGDIYVHAEIFTGVDEQQIEQWVPVRLLWQQPRAGQLERIFVVTGAEGGQQFNNECLFSTLIEKPVLDGLGQPVPDPDQPGSFLSTRRAGLLVPVDFIALDASGNPTDDAMPFVPSLPSPKVEIADVSVSAVTKGADGVLRGTVTIDGTVTSAVCDTLPSEQGGTIDEVKLYVNGAPEAEATIPLQVSKGTGATLGKPFPYSGTFTVSRPNVPITEGKNIFKVCAADKIYGIPGFGEWQVTVSPNYSSETVPPPHGLSADLPPDAAAFAEATSLVVNYTNPAGVTTPLNVARMAGGSNQFASADGAFLIEFSDAHQLNSSRRMTLRAVVTMPGAGLEEEVFCLSQSAAGSSSFAGVRSSLPASASEPPGEGEVPPEPSSYDAEEKYFLQESNGGTFHAGAVRVRAGPGIVEALRIKLGQNGLTYSLIASTRPGEYFLKRRDSEVPMIFSMRSRTAPANVDEEALLDTLQFLGELPSDFLEFQWGFLSGMAAGGWELVSGLADIVTGTVAYSARMQYLPVLDAYIYMATAAGFDPTTATAWRFEFQTKQDAVNQQNFALGKAVPPLLWTFMQLHQEQFSMTLDLLTLRLPLSEHSDVHRELFGKAAELLAEQWHGLVEANAEPKVQGYIMGRAIFEIASVLIPAAKAGTLPQLTKLEFLNTLAAQSQFFQAGGKGWVAMEALLNLRTGLAATKMCFVAGTKVWTREGLRDIETVRPGDWVLSRDEQTWVQDFKPVVAVAITHPAGLVHVRYAALARHAGSGKAADGGDEDEETLICTPQHPFFVSNRPDTGFVEAGKLAVGDEFALADGRRATVVSLTAQTAGPGERFTTYNFEVEDFHTYFVGEAGVWVHNHGRTYCEKLKSLYELFLERANNDVWTGHKLVGPKFDSLTGLDPRLAKDGLARAQMYTEARRRHFTDIPNSPTMPPWRAGGQKLTRTVPPASNSQMSAELADNMDEFLAIGRPEGFAAHHIVPHTRIDPGGFAATLRQLLASKGIHPNECANGIYLPHNSALAQAYPSLGPYHRTLHTNEYLQKLWNKLSPHSQKSADELRDQLQMIAHELSEGTF